MIIYFIIIKSNFLAKKPTGLNEISRFLKKDMKNMQLHVKALNLNS